MVILKLMYYQLMQINFAKIDTF